MTLRAVSSTLQNGAPGWQGKKMSDKTPSRRLPGGGPYEHTLSATRLRALAADATTGSLKARLLEEAKRLERIAANVTAALL
jgi:hypothetical protein